MLENGAVLDSRYEVISKIGQGGMSYVYKALDKKLNRFVALKVLKEEFSTDDEFVQKFRQEAQSVASLIHPNIVAAYDAVDEGELHYIVMELVEGRSLKYRIQHRGMISNDSAVEIALQTAEGIAAAHRNGIIHRDIKPQNIIISRDGTVKVADFGIAKAVTGETISTAVLGSAHYVSPEQAKKGISDERSDIYSLGITMYEMVTGSLPFDGENTVSVVMAHINKPMVPPEEVNPDVYPALNDIILKATRKNPADRYQTADEMIEDLKKCKEDPEGDFVFPETPVPSTDLNGSHKKSTDTKAKRLPVNRNVILGLVFLAAIGILIAVGIFLATELKNKKEDKDLAQGKNYESVATDVSIEVDETQLLPSVVGMDIEEAKNKLNEHKLTLTVEKEEYNDTYLAGIIIRQNPEEGTTYKPGDKVYVTVSLGSKLDSVLKSLKGISVQDATDRLKEVEVSILGINKQFSNDVEDGLVIGYLLNDNPDSMKTENNEEQSVSSEEVTGTKVNKGSSIILLVSAGKESEGAHVPSLIGLTVNDAAAVLESNGLRIGSINKVPSGNERDGKITAQSEPVNSPVKKGTAIDIEVNWNPNEALSYESAQSVFIDPNEEDELSPEFWYGSIDTSYNVGTNNGPSGSSNTKNIGIRLHQRLDDNDEYSVIAEPRPISSGTKMPVSYRSIRGAQGVSNGDIEVYDADTNTVLQTYPIQFYPLVQ